jgi:hypothetical protein
VICFDQCPLKSAVGCFQPKAPHVRAINLSRDQADKCRLHASHIADPETQVQLRKLAAEYIERAAVIEAAEIAVLVPFSQAPDVEPQPG